MHDPEVVAWEIRRPWPARGHWPGMITIWHVDPRGGDCFETCKRDSHWRWHVHHWHVQVHQLQALRRRLLTRCAWCGGRSGRRDPVNHSIGWNNTRAHWWRGESGVYHGDCVGVYRAWNTCTCADPVLEHADWGQCARCLRFRSWGQRPEASWRCEQLRRAIPYGTRNQQAYTRALRG